MESNGRLGNHNDFNNINVIIIESNGVLWNLKDLCMESLGLCIESVKVLLNFERF